MIYIEIIQALQANEYESSAWVHLFDIQNLMDSFQYIVNLMLIFVTAYDTEWPSDDARRIVGAVLVCIVWLKMFEWLKMFDATSFYIKLIIQTITDILPFFYIFPVFLFMFGSSLYILSTNRDDEH